MKLLQEVSNFYRLRRETILYIQWYYRPRGVIAYRFRAGPVPHIHKGCRSSGHHQHHRPQLREYFATNTPKKREEVFGVANFDPVRCDKFWLDPWEHEREYGPQKTWKAYRKRQHHGVTIDRHIHAPAYWEA